MDMDSIPFKTRNVQTHALGMRPEIAPGRSRGLLHDIAQLSRQGELMATGK